MKQLRLLLLNTRETLFHHVCVDQVKIIYLLLRFPHFLACKFHVLKAETSINNQNAFNPSYIRYYNYLFKCRRLLFNISTNSKKNPYKHSTCYSTLKRRGNVCFHLVSTWNTRGMFVGVPVQLHINQNLDRYYTW